MKIEHDVPTYFLDCGREVMARERGEPGPKTYTVRWQAEAAARKVFGVVIERRRKFHIGWAAQPTNGGHAYECADHGAGCPRTVPGWLDRCPDCRERVDREAAERRSE